MFIIVGIMVLGNGINNKFISDDIPQIVENNVVHSLKNIAIPFFKDTRFNGDSPSLGPVFYRPIPAVIFTLIYSVFREDFTKYHSFQISIYIVNTCLLFLFLKRIFKTPTAFVMALLFLVHPINSENAFYIANTQDVLFFSFGMFSVLILQSAKAEKHLIISAFCLLLSLLSKETGILFVPILILYSFLFRRKFFSFLFFALMLVVGFYLALRINAVGLLTHSTLLSPIQNLDIFGRLLNVPAIFIYYLRTFVFPQNLSMFYHWIVNKIDFINFIFPLVIDLGFLSVIFYYLTSLCNKNKFKYFTIYTFFLFWFLSGMLFHLQIVPLDQTVAEHWFYFPMVGLLGMIGVGIETFKIDLKYRLIIIILILIIGCLSIRTIIRSFDWKNDLTIALHDIRVSKDSYVLEDLLTYNYYKLGRYYEATQHAKNSVKIYPNVINYTNLGVAYFYLEDYPKAKEAYLKALKLGDYDLTYSNLAVLSLVYGEPYKNINFIKDISLKKYPKNFLLWLVLARLEYLVGNKESAKKDVTNAYKYNPNSETKFYYFKIMNNKPIKSLLN